MGHLQLSLGQVASSLLSSEASVHSRNRCFQARDPVPPVSLPSRFILFQLQSSVFSSFGRGCNFGKKAFYPKLLRKRWRWCGPLDLDSGVRPSVSSWLLLRSTAVWGFVGLNDTPACTPLQGVGVWRSLYMSNLVQFLRSFVPVTPSPNVFVLLTYTASFEAAQSFFILVQTGISDPP